MTKYAVTIYTTSWRTHEVEANSPHAALLMGEKMDEQTGRDPDGSDWAGYNVRDEETDQTWNDTDDVTLDQMEMTDA